jgi:hypothetical protein
MPADNIVNAVNEEIILPHGRTSNPHDNVLETFRPSSSPHVFGNGSYEGKDSRREAQNKCDLPDVREIKTVIEWVKRCEVLYATRTRYAQTNAICPRVGTPLAGTKRGASTGIRPAGQQNQGVSTVLHGLLTAGLMLSLLPVSHTAKGALSVSI